MEWRAIKIFINEHKRTTENRLKSLFSHKKIIPIMLHTNSIYSNTTQGFYMQERKMSTIQTLLPIMKEDINFLWARKCCGSVIKSIRLMWRMEGTKVKVIPVQSMMAHRRKRGIAPLILNLGTRLRQVRWRKCPSKQNGDHRGR
jgi:hypothetical protein